MQTLPNAIEVRAELRLILGSPAFSDAPMLTAFLKYVVEATLGGRSDRIKAYTIAVDGLGRPPDFDPEADAIVRVHAIRVRRALRLYYAAAGADDAIIVDLPRRRYVPTFRRLAPPAALPPAPLIIPPRRPSADMTQPASRGRHVVSDWIGKLFKRSPPQISF